MTDKIKVTLAVIAILLLPIGLTFYELGYKKFFKPKFQNVEREVFKQTRSYNEGKIQDLAKLKHEYELASNEDKQTIKNTIIHMFADYQAPKEAPYGLKQFLTEMRGY